MPAVRNVEGCGQRGKTKPAGARHLLAYAVCATRFINHLNFNECVCAADAAGRVFAHQSIALLQVRPLEHSRTDDCFDNVCT